MPQVAVFDTGFHSQIVRRGSVIYPGPYEWAEHGIRNSDFTGLTTNTVQDAPRNCSGRDTALAQLVTCHLGNGCSLAAIHNGHSVDTTMGFTPLEGLMMGLAPARSSGNLTYLVRQKAISGKSLDEILNRNRAARNFRDLRRHA